MITPTVGRMVWYRPEGDSFEGIDCNGQPLAATVSHVWHDRCVNLSVCDPNGNWHGRTSVVLVQDDEPIPDTGSFCEWMPYQKGQAAKAEALEQQLNDSGAAAPSPPTEAIN